MGLEILARYPVTVTNQVGVGLNEKGLSLEWDKDIRAHVGPQSSSTTSFSLNKIKMLGVPEKHQQRLNIHSSNQIMAIHRKKSWKKCF